MSWISTQAAVDVLHRVESCAATRGRTTGAHHNHPGDRLRRTFGWSPQMNSPQKNLGSYPILLLAGFS